MDEIENLTLNPSPSGGEGLPEDEQPVFDFGLLSWGESRQIDRVKARLNAATSADLDELDAAILAFQTHVCKVLISVPRAWLVATAPDVINWADGASLDWLKKKYFQKLVTAWQTASELDEAAGG